MLCGPSLPSLYPLPATALIHNQDMHFTDVVLGHSPLL